MQNSDPITWKIDKNIGKNPMFSLNNMENSPKGLLMTSRNSPLYPTGHRSFGAAAQKAMALNLSDD